MKFKGSPLTIQLGFLLTLLGSSACAQTRPQLQPLSSCEKIKGIEFDAIILQTIKTVKGVSQSESRVPLEPIYYPQMDRPQKIVVKGPKIIKGLALITEGREVKPLELDKGQAPTVTALLPKFEHFKGALVVQLDDRTSCKFDLTFMELAP